MTSPSVVRKRCDAVCVPEEEAKVSSIDRAKELGTVKKKEREKEKDIIACITGKSFKFYMYYTC